jgi:hypothetical protein
MNNAKKMDASQDRRRSTWPIDTSTSPIPTWTVMFVAKSLQTMNDWFNVRSAGIRATTLVFTHANSNARRRKRKRQSQSVLIGALTSYTANRRTRGSIVDKLVAAITDTMCSTFEYPMNAKNTVRYDFDMKKKIARLRVRIHTLGYSNRTLIQMVYPLMPIEYSHRASSMTLGAPLTAVIFARFRRYKMATYRWNMSNAAAIVVSTTGTQMKDMNTCASNASP